MADINDIDKRLAVCETKIEIQEKVIGDIKCMITGLDEKIDKLLESSASSKVKIGLMWAGYASGLVAVITIILQNFVK